VKGLTLEYWHDDGWFVGKLRELEENVLDAHQLMIGAPDPFHLVVIETSSPQY
jgi:hypothetical protein